MFNKKCPDCKKKVEKKFNYCPWCGTTLKNTQEDYGMLGKDDMSISKPKQLTPQMNLPFGMNNIVNSLVKQLEKELGNMDPNQTKIPKNFNIRIATNKPQFNNNPQQQIQPKKQQVQQITIEEANRRNKLPKEEADSKVRRLGDKIYYEITTPGIKNKNEIIITSLEQGLEVKAYTKDKCYVKIIPLNINLTRFKIEKDKVILEFNS